MSEQDERETTEAFELHPLLERTKRFRTPIAGVATSAILAGEYLVVEVVKHLFG